MPAHWNVLVIDDDDDVHSVTALALKRKTWRGRTIAQVHARSGAEAREILLNKDSPTFHCILLDVVMESDDAGLLLCDFIRTNLSRATRIVLRTGQPGAAPEERVMNDYDIDYYLAKAEVTDARLFPILRSCFRSSSDIDALLQVSAQMTAFTHALQDASTTRETLADIMTKSLHFLEDKYAAQIVFVHDIEAPPEAPGFDGAAVGAAVAQAYSKRLAPLELIPGTEVGLPPNTSVVMTTRLAAVAPNETTMGDKIKRWVFHTVLGENMVQEEGAVGIVVRFEQTLATRVAAEFLRDLGILVTNWRVAEGSWRLQVQFMEARAVRHARSRR